MGGDPLNAHIAATDLALTATTDSVLASLQHLARRFDRPSSPVVLVSGLALSEDGRLPFHQVESAAERIGFRAHTMRRDLSRLAQHDMPALLEMADDRAVALVEIKDKQGLVFDPARGEEVWTSLAKLQTGYAGRLVLLEPDPAR